MGRATIEAVLQMSKVGGDSCPAVLSVGCVQKGGAAVAGRQAAVRPTPSERTSSTRRTRAFASTSPSPMRRPPVACHAVSLSLSTCSGSTSATPTTDQGFSNFARVRRMRSSSRHDRRDELRVRAQLLNLLPVAVHVVTERHALDHQPLARDGHGWGILTGHAG